MWYVSWASEPGSPPPAAWPGGARAGLGELGAHRVDDVLRHQAHRRELAARDRQEAAHAVALLVIEHRVCTRDVARRAARLCVLEQRPDAGPHAHGAGLAEAGDEALAVVEHL